jgi:ABC-type antimicrobial peptide transport system permease subunit
MVFRRGLSVAAAGVVLGLAGAIAANQLLSALLFEVSPTDPLILGGIAMALLGIAALASLLPARASTKIQPIEALRAD